jgi:hypothetical protein
MRQKPWSNPVPQPPENKTSLSVHRAFVVHFRAEFDVARGQVAGRVEHVVSGQITHFHSLKDLLTFVARVLAQDTRQPPNHPTKKRREE